MKYPKLDYYEDTNSFAIQIGPGPSVGGKDIAEGVIATFDAQDRLVGIELVGDVARDYPELVEALRGQSQAQPRRWNADLVQSHAMKVPWMEYEEDTNTFIIAFSSDPGEGGVSEISPGVLTTFDTQDRLVAIELEGDVAKEYPELVASLREQSNAKPLRKTGT